MIKKITISLASLLLLSILGFFIFSFSAKDDAASAASAAKQRTSVNPPQFPPSRPISDSLAYAFFENYHHSATPTGSQGLLRNKGQAITQFYLDQASVIEPLKQKAMQLHKEFIGLSAIPAYNGIDSTHTLIWVAVVDADPGVGVSPELMLPGRGDQWQDYIYDFAPPCPTDCPVQSNRLWNTNWNP